MFYVGLPSAPDTQWLLLDHIVGMHKSDLDCRRSDFTKHSRREYEKVMKNQLYGIRIPISSVFFLCKMSNGTHSLQAGNA
jgi:hypothetical protein